MPKDDIKRIVEDSKQLIEKDRQEFAVSIRKDLDSFKRKTLDGL